MYTACLTDLLDQKRRNKGGDLISIASATFAIYLTMIAAIGEEAAVNEPQLETYEITAYTVGDDFTPSHGITASGRRVRVGMAACPPSLPFGTKIYIPELNRTVTCTDRGGRIKGRKLDIYMASRSKAMDFGRRKMKVEIISE